MVCRPVGARPWSRGRRGADAVVPDLLAPALRLPAASGLSAPRRGGSGPGVLRVFLAEDFLRDVARRRGDLWFFSSGVTPASRGDVDRHQHTQGPGGGPCVHTALDDPGITERCEVALATGAEPELNPSHGVSGGYCSRGGRGRTAPGIRGVGKAGVVRRRPGLAGRRGAAWEHASRRPAWEFDGAGGRGRPSAAALPTDRTLAGGPYGPVAGGDRGRVASVAAGVDGAAIVIVRGFRFWKRHT